VVVLAVTELYMSKIEKAAVADNCAKEFGATRVKKLPSQILPVFMEAKVRSPLDWTGPLATCDMLTGVDFTSDDKGDCVAARVRSVVIGVDTQQQQQQQQIQQQQLQLLLQVQELQQQMQKKDEQIQRLLLQLG
jgi:hypothetical protein